MKVETLNENISRNDIRFIAEKTGYSKSYVSKVLNSERSGDSIGGKKVLNATKELLNTSIRIKRKYRKLQPQK